MGIPAHEHGRPSTSSVQADAHAKTTTGKDARTTLDFLFVESAGIEEAWPGAITDLESGAGKELRELLRPTREQQIPTVFWDTAQTLNAERQTPNAKRQTPNVAALFDFVFTVDPTAIDWYKARLGHDRVYLLPFAADPATHNPVNRGDVLPRFGFLDDRTTSDSRSGVGKAHSRYPRDW